MNQYRISFAVPADDADEAIRGLRRMVRALPAAELAERVQIEEIIGDLTLDEGMTARQVRKLLRALAL